MTDHDGHGPAIAAITRVLERNDGADPEVTARHILTALAGIGWRRTNAQPAPPGGPPVPATEEFQAARALADAVATNARILRQRGTT